MATKRKTTTTRKPSAAAQKKEQAVWGSIALFACGLLFTIMLFVEGQSLWLWVRTALFGVFGASMYVLGVALIYLAVLVAQQEAIGGMVLKLSVGLVTLSGTAILFSSFSTEGLEGFAILAAFYDNGVQSVFGGGVLGAIAGGALLALCGRPAANILVVVLFLCVVMLLTGITPAEVAAFFADRFGNAKTRTVSAREGYLERRAARDDERAARAEERAREQQEREEAAAKDAQAGIAVEDAQPQHTRSAAAQAILDGVDTEPEDDMQPKEPAPWARLFGKRAPEPEAEQPTNEPTAPTQPRPFFDIDLGPDNIAVTKGQSEPIEPIVIGPGGTFGADPLGDNYKKPEDFSMPLEPVSPPRPAGTAPLPDGAAAAAAVAAEIRAAAGQGEGNPFGGAPKVQSAPEGAACWIRMSDDGVQSSDSAEIANLAAAALEKPLVADLAAAQTPAVQQAQVKEYRYPPITLFEQVEETEDKSAAAELKANAKKLVDTLESFGVKTRMLDISRGPSVTRYELQPLAGVKISRITNLADDIALNLAVAGVRIEAPIPGKPAVGIEVPNRVSNSVSIRGIFESQNFTHMPSPLSIALGKDIAGVAQVADLCKMPHLLVAGSTGSGKSVCVNSIIMSFLYRSSPEEVKLILIDPKVVELAEYNGIPHLLMPVVTEPRKAAGALGSAVAEMEKRYRLFADNNVRDIKTFNALASETQGLEKLPYIAIVIDELADLMMVSGKEVEDYICRIAQKARAAGMHLIVATQRPSVDVITGLIKANIPSRISFAVSSQIDSRTILDATGAEKLLGMGDMLFMPVGASKPVRIQGTYVKDAEISSALSYIKASSSAAYSEEMIAEMEKVAANQKGAPSGNGAQSDDGGEMDAMLKQCAEVVIEAGQASTSLLQRRCKLGYARAARIMDEMEQLHIIGPYEGAKPRAVLVSRQQWLEMTMAQTDAEQETPEQLEF